MPTKNTLLLVDDMASNRAFLRRLFADDYDLLEAEDGEDALQIVAEHHSRIAAVLLDLIMPGKDGYQVLAELGEKGYLSHIPVIVVTSDGSQKSEARALELGASDLVSKPYDPYVIRRRVQNLVEQNRSRQVLTQQVDHMSEVMNLTNDSIVNTLATITEFRSLESGQHILRIRKFVQILLREVSYSFPEYELDDKTIATVSSAAVLHDIGKISIPDSILNKPGKLTAEEFEVMKTHTTAGCEILEMMTQVVDREYMRYAYNICRYHHERWDGTGYPDGLKGGNIPICAQVAGLADVYDALTTKRVYKDALSHEESVNMILSGECGAFDPRLLECFKHVCPEFAACAREYADGALLKAEDIHIPLPAPQSLETGPSSRQLATIKYHTLLGHVGGTVLEVDVNADSYHLVFDENKLAFHMLKDASFSAVAQRLITECIHQEDKESARQCYAYVKEDFFREGVRKYAQRFRAKLGEAGQYKWTEFTFLRVDSGDPAQRRLLITCRQWSDSSRRSTATERLDKWGLDTLRDMMGCVLRCRNDKWQTIVEGGSQLADFLGYTEAELANSFRSHLLSVILPEDRDLVLTHASRQLTSSSAADVEYRLVSKGGNILWARDRACAIVGEDGVEYICHAIVDNTFVRSALDQLRSARERHQLLLAQISEIVFEWEISTDYAVFSPNFKKQFGFEPTRVGLAQKIVDGKSAIHPDDLEYIKHQLHVIRDQQDYPSFLGTDFRLRKADGTYVWCRLRANSQQVENGKMECLVGTISPLNMDRRITDILDDKQARDALTRLCNKQAAKERIETYLAERRIGEHCALLLLDVDNFSDVNQRYGRIAGDAMLLQLSDLLKKLFHRGDVIARIGGDEFMILIQNVPSQSYLQSHCEHLIDVLTQEASKGAPGCQVSCSVGVALAPEDGNTFEELFVRAQTALSTARQKGQGTYAFYQQGDLSIPDQPDGTSPIESEGFSDLADQSLVRYAFDRLYQSGDVESTIQSILEIIGRQMNVSRAYIFENSPDNRFCSNTFEWCNEGIRPEIDNLQNLSYETDVPGWKDYYNAQGVFLCENLDELSDHLRAFLEPQGIKSMLQCAIMDGGVFRGFVGLDECVTDRIWTQDQLDVLSMVTELTSVFLLKKRVRDASDQWARSLVSALDNSSSWIYVINPDTHEILFSNTRVQSFFPKIKPGICCYKALMNRDIPCPDCPALDIRAKNRASSLVVNERMGFHMRANATLIKWNGADAALIECSVAPGR